MDKKSKTLLAILLIITVASVSYTFYKTLVQQDFEVVNTKTIEAVGEDPAATEEEVASPGSTDAEPIMEEK